MKKAFIIFLLLTFNAASQAQKLFKVKAIKKNNQVFFYAINNNYCPYQVIVEIYDTINIETQVTLPFYAEIPPQSDSLFLFKVKTTNPEKPDVIYHYSYSFGKQEIKPDKNYHYLMPFQHGTSHFVAQSYFGKFSHKGVHAIDFKMKQGTPICAARGGVVIAMREDSNLGGKTSAYARDANYIRIYHEDGTYASYLHLMQEGSLVEIGDVVKAGEIIAYAGNTGWSTMAHLHFEVRKPIKMDYVSILTKFYFRKKGKASKRVKAWRFYKAYHPEKENQKTKKTPRKKGPKRESR